MSKCRNCVRFIHLNDDGEKTLGHGNWCCYISDSPDEDKERVCCAYKAITNADRIRAMTDEELAEWIYQVQDGDAYQKENYLPPLSKSWWFKWLKQEATE